MTYKYTMYIQTKSECGEIQKQFYALSDSHALAQAENVLPFIVSDVSKVHRIAFALLEPKYMFIKSWIIKGHIITVEANESKPDIHCIP